MSVYEELGIRLIVNASDTYTKIGGSRMSEAVLAAMQEAGRHFVDICELGEKVGAAIAGMTHNEAGFISSGCAACVVLASAALMAGGDARKGSALPDTDACERNEFVVFDVQTKIPALPYWRLIELSGAKLVRAEPTIGGLKQAIGAHCAGVWLFAGTQYEGGLPPFGEVIAAAHEMGVPVLVDAAAQIPPVSNLWYYTRDLGADGAVFSGGKFIMGPQSTGLFVGKAWIAKACRALSSPNVHIGRPYKVGKEEYAAFYAAVKQLMESDEAAVFACHNRLLDEVEQGLAGCAGLRIERLQQGRLGQCAPRLLIGLPQGKTGRNCSEFLYSQCDPAVDIGFFPPEDETGKADEIYINSINLQQGDPAYIVQCLCRYLRG